ncbi:cytochrome P450 [Artemisia annua]|uniref:Cytochrome P450 n=1 Tax=Artemisia annua TaxID=35608 RepID=A0A2U1M1Q5_ARTAN|nr:cytochrome P450 [Artemisia annua]
MARFRSSEGGIKLLPGHMGLPIIGEMFTFLWYGDGIGMYKTHLFGRPSVIVFSSTAIKYAFRAEESFLLDRPNVEIVGKSSLVAVHGKTHARLRSFVSRSTNQPDALRQIARLVQPRMVSGLQCWAKRGKINSYEEIKKDEEGSQLSDEEVLDNIISILVAGYESTTLATMWAVYHLAKYPKVLQKLRDENMSLKKSKNEQFVTSDEILKMEYTMKVVDETIRMANIAAFVFRTTTKDVNYQGYTIPKGWNVMIWIRYLHTDPKNFNDPLCFNPDRWDVPMVPGTYQVFGGGSRLCAGNMLARLQLAIFLYHLSTGYKWELVNLDAELIYLSHPKPEDGVEISIEKL